MPIGGNVKTIGGNLYDASGRSLLPKGLPPGLTMQQLQNAVAQGLLPSAANVNAASKCDGGYCTVYFMSLRLFSKILIHHCSVLAVSRTTVLFCIPLF